MKLKTQIEFAGYALWGTEHCWTGGAGCFDETGGLFSERFADACYLDVGTDAIMRSLVKPKTGGSCIVFKFEMDFTSV